MAGITIKDQPNTLTGITDVGSLAQACQENFEPLYRALRGTVQGGVGLPTAVSQGSLFYASAANTVSELTKNATASRYLSNSGDDNNPAWAQVDLTNGVTGTLPVGKGGTGVTTFGGTNHLLYTTATDTLSSIAPAANQILKTDGLSVPQWSATLPAVNGSLVTNLDPAQLSTTVKISKGGTGLSTFTKGDILTYNSGVTLSRVTGNTTTTRKWLSGTGTGAAAGIPAWNTIAMTDLPAGGTWTLTSALTLSGAGLLFSADNTYDIGANGATRPKDLYLAGDLIAGDQLFERGRTTALGEAIAVTFAAGNFTTDAGTWTVESGDQYAYWYSLVGKMMFLNIDLRLTTVSGSPQQLRVAVPGGFTINRYSRAPVQVYDAGTPQLGLLVAAAGNSYVHFTSDFSSTAWTTSTNTTYVIGQIWFEVV